MTSVSPVRYEVSEHIATITLCRPDAGNAIDELMAAALRDACESARQDDEVRVVMLTGAGDAFCLGTAGDAGMLAPDDIARLRVSDAVAAIEKPVIALINGDALDQGLELALACDARIAAADARLGLTQVRRGAMPWDGGTQRLPRLIGQSIALEMILTGRIARASDAADIGLVNWSQSGASDASEYAYDLAARMAAHAPIAARYLKETLLKGADMTLAQGLALEADLSVILQSTSDRAEGIGSFLERRAPRYRGK